MHLGKLQCLFETYKLTKAKKINNLDHQFWHIHKSQSNVLQVLCYMYYEFLEILQARLTVHMKRLRWPNEPLFFLNL